MDENRNAYSIKEFGRRNGIGRTTIYELIKTGTLAAIKVRNRTLILHDDEREWLSSLKATASPKAT